MADSEDDKEILMAVKKSILGKAGWEDPKHNCPTTAIFVGGFSMSPFNVIYDQVGQSFLLICDKQEGQALLGTEDARSNSLIAK